jgi:hypothetical protein
MSVNKVKILQNQIEAYLNIPINMDWDFSGRDQAIEEYESQMVKEVLGLPLDFETVRFANNQYNNGDTGVNYEFNFYNYQLPITASTVTTANWGSTYLNRGFSSEQIFYYRAPFTKSFFKLDFYDTPDEKTQKNYITIVIPVTQGEKQLIQVQSLTGSQLINKPTYILDYIGDKEGFFIYWLRDRDYIDLTRFYMSAKFFDGRQGVFVRMTNTPQTQMTPNKFLFNNANYFYYLVDLNYNNKTYEIKRTDNFVRVGDPNAPIKWYEYVNP